MSARSPRAERFIRRVGLRVQPLARHAPAVYRPLRDAARWANMRPVASSARGHDEEARVELREFFAPDLPTLGSLVKPHVLVTMPAWLSGS